MMKLSYLQQAGNHFWRNLRAVLPTFAFLICFGVWATAQNYTITVNSGTLEITDASGNSETLEVAQSGDNISFNASGRIYSINGGSVMNMPALIPLIGITSITINTAGGNDVINIGAFSAELPSLTINGGTGNDAVNLTGDITFAPNANLDVDLQNDNPTPGVDYVIIGWYVNLTLQGNGAATIKTSGRIEIYGSHVITADGALTLEANQQATASSGAFKGVLLSYYSTVEATGIGAVSVKGRGGNSGHSNHGVMVLNGSVIKGGLSGAVTVQGTGGASSGNDHIGVLVVDYSAMITSAGANVTVIGQGGGAGSSAANRGVALYNTGQITAGGNGTVTVTGTGGSGTTSWDNNGVAVHNENSMITSAGGNVMVTGFGGGSGSSGRNHGVALFNAGQIAAGGNAEVTVMGTGGAATGNDNYGVFVTGGGTSITSSGGDVNVSGQGGGSGSSSYNWGVGLTYYSMITAGGLGKVTVNGTGGLGTGVEIMGIFCAVYGKITSSGGDVNITAQGGGTGNAERAYGMMVYYAGTVSAGGNGNVTINATGAPRTNFGNYGFFMFYYGSVTSSGGNVLINGFGGGSGSAYNNHGVYIQAASWITAGENGSVTVDGTGGPGNGQINVGVYVTDGGSAITSGGGNVIVHGQGGGIGAANYGHGVSIRSGGNIRASGNGTVTITGIGGPSTGENHGVFIDQSGSVVYSQNGDIFITGAKGTNSASGFPIDLHIYNGGSVISEHGNITLTGGVTGIYANSPSPEVNTSPSNTLKFGSGAKYWATINGTTPNSSFTQLQVVGGIDLSNASLTFAQSGYTPSPGNSFSIIDNDGTDPVVGTFAGLPEGGMITNFLGSNKSGRITYQGGSGNDVVISVCPPPVIHCVAGSVVFNGESMVVIDAASLVVIDENCGGVGSITASPSQIECSKIGQVMSVTVTVTDLSGSSSSCTTTITVGGLPCGWAQNPNGINCTGGSNPNYNMATGEWTLTSTNCYYAPHYTSDVMSYVQSSLCGDGSITAQVTNISGTGWAGVTMRESSAAGAKKVQLMTNLGPQSHREFRTTTNGPAQFNMFLSPNRYWLRIVRTGNQFALYNSFNGQTWFFVAAQTITMGNCIEIGLVATNLTANSTVTATFANVDFTGGIAPLVTAGANTAIHAAAQEPEFNLFPNPTTAEVNIDLSTYFGRAVSMEIHNLQGQLMQTSTLEEAPFTARFDLSAYQNGMYLVTVKCGGFPEVTKRVVVQR